VTCRSRLSFWRGSIRSSSFFKRLSFRRNKKLGNQAIILKQNSQTLDSNEQYDKKRFLRNFKEKPDYFSCQSEQNLTTKTQPPPKPPRLYLDTASCPDIIDHRGSSSTDISFLSTSCHFHKTTQTPTDLCKAQTMNSETFSRNNKPPFDPSDPFLSFTLDLGPSLLDDVLQTLRKQNLLLN
uniref:Chromosome 15 open reading frame 62 n=1 Tax=Naja naja TaxID=35670 RepID=A0A8C6X1G4_NAJNA